MRDVYDENSRYNTQEAVQYDETMMGGEVISAPLHAKLSAKSVLKEIQVLSKKAIANATLDVYMQETGLERVKLGTVDLSNVGLMNLTIPETNRAPSEGRGRAIDFVAIGVSATNSSFGDIKAMVTFYQ